MMGAAAAGFIAGACCAAVCALRSRTASAVGRRGPDEGTEKGRRRRAFGRGRRKRARECRWDIPISGVDYVVEWADRGDRRRRGRDADCANGERVGAARMRTSEADLASLWGRDMTVTRAVPDSQNTEGHRREHRSDVRGALASYRCGARSRRGPGRLRVNGSRRRWRGGAKISRGFGAGDERVHRRKRGAAKCAARHRRNDEFTNQQSASSSHPVITHAAKVSAPVAQPTRGAASTSSVAGGLEARTSPCRRLPSSRRSPVPWWTLRRRPRAWKTSRCAEFAERYTAPSARTARECFCCGSLCSKHHGQVLPQAVLLRRPAGAFMGPPER